jgi:non-heme chloroperoxidase
MRVVVKGSEGVDLVVHDEGLRTDQAIIFVHGWSQSSLSWKYQISSSLSERYRLVTYDLRGHGMSAKPLGDTHYSDEVHWADDLLSIIESLKLTSVILVGWSFGGYVICDYLRRHGDQRVVGINFVSWAVMIGNTDKERALTGAGFNRFFPGATSLDLQENIAAMRGFVKVCAERDIGVEDYEEILAYNMMVSPDIRRAVASRGVLDNTPLLEKVSVPVLITQGDADQVTKRAAASHILNACQNSVESIFEGVGHLPFIEDRERYNTELSKFADQIFLDLEMT